MSRPRIVVIGSSNTDLVIRADHIPAPGETVLGGSFLTAAGGKGANQAVAAARLGADVSFVGRVGTDAFGEAALQGLEREGIDVSRVVRDDDAPSGVALIVVGSDGENAIAVAPGANGRLCPEDLDGIDGHIQAADVVLLQLEIPLEAVKRALEIARAAATPVILNPAPARIFERALLRSVSVLTPNQSEAGLLTAMTVGDDLSARRAAEALRRRGVPTVVITLAADGALLATEAGCKHVHGPAVIPVDSTGAGDAFNGALAVGLASGMPHIDAVRFATTAGAAAVTRPGAQPSLPTRAEVEQLLETLER